MKSAARELAPDVGVATACRSLGVSRATYYRSVKNGKSPERSRTRRSPRALSESERHEVLSVLHDLKYVDESPATVYGKLMDEEQRYLCSIRTMYRILASEGENRERRNQRKHPKYSVPRVVATGPNQVWTWDITKLLGPVKWTYYYLYVILDLYSRYAVGWMLARRECSKLARKLIEETYEKEGLGEGDLTLHSDRGSPMKSKSLALLLADLGVTKSHSRPRVSNDNPFSESQFKTLKSRPMFPRRFGSFEDGLSFLREFFPWYNEEHYHSGLGLFTPEMVHRGEAPRILESRRAVLGDAYRSHPDRFVRGRPTPMAPASEVWINKPESTTIVATQSGEGDDSIH